MADNVAQYVFDIDSSSARSATSDLIKFGKAAVDVSDRLDTVNKSVRDSSGRFISLEQSVLKSGDRVSALAREFNTASSATMLMQQYQIRLNEAVGLGIATQEEARVILARYHQQLQQGLPLYQQQQAAAREQANADAQLAARKEELSSKFIPLYAQSKKYEAAIRDLTEAQRLLGLSDKQVAAQQSILASRYLGVGKAAGEAAKGSNNATFALTNASFQIQDFAVQVASGQSALTAFAQQFPQLASAIGFSGKIGLYGALIGTAAAIGVSLIPMFIKSGAEAKATADKIKTLSTSLNDFIAAQQALGAGQTLDQVLSAQNIAKANAELEKAKKWLDLVVENQNATLVSLDEYGALSLLAALADNKRADATKAVAEAQDLVTKLQIRQNQAANEVVMTLQQNNALAKIQLQYGRDSAQYREAQFSFEEAAFRKQQESKGILGDNLDIVMQTWREWKTNVQYIDDATAAAGRLASATMDALAKTKSLFPGQDTGTPLYKQGWGGTSLGLDLTVPSPPKTKSGGGSSNKRDPLQQLKEGLERQSTYQISEYERQYKVLQDSLAKKKLAQEDYNKYLSMLQTQYFGTETEKEAQQYQISLTALQTALNNKLITQQKYNELVSNMGITTYGTQAQQGLLQYQTELSTLQTALDNKYITQQTYYQRLRQLQSDYYSGATSTDQNGYATNLSAMSTYFGDLNSLAGGGYDTLAKAQKTFAASSAFINAYLAASQALADPTVPYWGKFAAYAKVLAAGLGIVNAIKSGGSSSSGSSSSASATTATTTAAQQTQTVLVSLDGSDFMVDLAESIMTQIYDQTKDGRKVVVQRAN